MYPWNKHYKQLNQIIEYSFISRKELTKHLFQECLPTGKASKVQLK